ncbi:MAG: hypothetical protein HZA78_11190 [Candidatus Schekmanbacteria bacterium]|nr:hypothetical protein [Candidatus Schekmanbacteria bacterium]
MLWNFIIQFIAGILGANLFIWSGMGLLSCLTMTGVIQAIDMFRIYHITVKRIRQQPQHIQEQQMATFTQRLFITFPQLYIAKVIGYGLITFIVAYITRSIIL